MTQISATTIAHGVSAPVVRYRHPTPLAAQDMTCALTSVDPVQAKRTSRRICSALTIVKEKQYRMGQVPMRS